MARLLVQSCSKSKQATESSTAAYKLYTGYYFKIIKKAKRDERFDNTIDIRILSAKHGLIAPEEQIVTYDRRMDPTRAAELREGVLDSLERLVDRKGYDEVIVNVGQVYAGALDGLEDRIDARLNWLEGGLGERGAQLKSLVREHPTEQTQA